MRLLVCAGLIGALALGGCAAAPPPGPSVMAMPGKDKTFEMFQADDASCRDYAAVQVGYKTPGQASTESAVNSAALGTILGAAAGAAIGAATGNPAAGAAIGAGSGLFLGGVTGLNAANASGASIQSRYDMAYVQCMSAKGENVPRVAGYPGGAIYPTYYGGYGYYPYSPYGYGYGYPYYPYYYPSGFFGASFVFRGGGHGHFHGGHGGGHHR
jgi:hypothetical protein